MNIQCRSLRGYLQSISGLFISQANPGGLTPKELDVLARLIFVLEEYKTDQIDAQVKAAVGAMMNYPVQVVTNYMKKLRDKKVLTKDNKIHPIVTSHETTIRFVKSEENKNNL
jgi:hypothetical protein